MAKPELGSKRVCVQCGTRFYDLLKQPAICPKCGAEQPPEQPRLRRPPSAIIEDKRPKKAVAPELEDADIEVVEDADVIEDAADLEDDADTLDADIEVEPDSDETDR